MSNYTTGELAKLCGVTVRTVQYYDTRGVLTPAALSEGGRRLYSDGDLRRMRVICFLRELGLPIETVKQILAEQNAGDVIYNGGRDIKIPELTLQGLGDYDRDEGQPIGSVGFAYRTYTMSQDRGRKFRLDENDINETNFGTAAARVMSEFQRTQVVPEIDAYRYSKIANLAGTKSVDTITAANVMPTLYNQLYALANAGVDINNIIVTISYPLFAMINMSGDINRNITVSDFQQGSVTLKIRDLDGAKLIPVSSDRLKTAYVFRDGKTSGQEAGGFTPAQDAAAINWIIWSIRTAISMTCTTTSITT